MKNEIIVQENILNISSRDHKSEIPKESTEQIENKIVKLPLKELKILLYIYNNCSLKGSNISGRISNDELAKRCESKKSSIATLVSNLKRKNLIESTIFNRGPSPWRIYKMKSEVLNLLHMSQSILDIKRSLTDHKKIEKKSSIISPNNNYNFKYNSNDHEALEVKWKDLVIPESLKNIFSPNFFIDLKNIAPESFEICQENLNRIGYDQSFGNDKDKPLNKMGKGKLLGMIINLAKKLSYYNSIVPGYEDHQKKIELETKKLRLFEIKEKDYALYSEMRKNAISQLSESEKGILKSNDHIETKFKHAKTVSKSSFTLNLSPSKDDIEKKITSLLIDQLNIDQI